MISKSTRKNRRNKTFANENRARLTLVRVDARVDFWLLGIKKSIHEFEWIEVRGKVNAVKRLRRMSSFMGSKIYHDCIKSK